MDRNNSTTPEREKGQHRRFEDRCSIKTCRKLKLSLRKTAEVVGCVTSTVLNELRKGTGTRNGNRGRFPEYSAKKGQANYEINRSRCHRDSSLDPHSPFISWMVNQVREHGWSLDACVGRAKKKKLFPEEQIFCTSTLYDAVWAGKIPGKDSASVMAAMEVLREEYGEEKFTEIFKTITADNGSEFDTLSELEFWGVSVYFAHPYSSWKRAQN